MSLWDTVDYLSKLGIHGLFEDVITKAVVVPGGFRATHLISNKTYEKGDFIPVPEKSWDEFVNAAQGDRSSNWNIEETGDVELAPVTHGTYKNSLERLLENGYNEQDLGGIYRFMMEEASKIQDESLRAETIDKVDDFVMDLHAELDAREDVKLEEKIKIKDRIREFQAQVEVTYNSSRGVVSLSLGRGDVHFGALVAAIEISGNQNVLQQMQLLMSNVTAGKNTGQLNINAGDMFPNGLRTSEEQGIYKELLVSLRDGADEDRLVLGAARVGAMLKSVLNDSAAPRDIVINAERLIEEAARVKDYLSNVEDRDAEQEAVLNAVKGLDFAKNVREFQRSLVSGNLLAQTAIDYSEAVLGKLDFNLIKLLDEHMNFEEALGTSLVDTLQHYIVSGDRVTDDIKKHIKDRLYGKILTAKSFQEVRKGRTSQEVLTQLGGDIRGIFTGTLSSGAALAVSEQSGISPSQIEELFSGGTLSEFAAKLSNPEKFKQITAEEMINAGKTLHDGKQALFNNDWNKILVGIIGRYNLVSNNEIPERDILIERDKLKAAIKKPMGAYYKLRKNGKVSFLDKEGNIKGLSTDTKALKKSSVEGLVSLAAFAIHSTWKDSSGMDSDALQRAATAAVFFSGGKDIKVNPETGGLVNESADGTAYMHMRVLSLARFLPPLTKDGYQWADDVKKDMDIEILIGKGKTPEEITDFDRLEYFSSDETIKPIHATGENIRAGLKNLRVGNHNNPNDSRQRVDRLLTDNEAEELASIIDYDTSVGINKRRVERVNEKMRNFIGNKQATPEFSDYNLARGELGENETLEGYSLSSLVARIRDYDEEPETRANFVRNLGQLASNRIKRNIPEGTVPEHIRNEIASYIRNNIIDSGSKLGKGKGTTIGYHFEGIAYIPILLANLEDAVSLEVLTPKVYENGATARNTMDAFDGVKWKDKRGNTHLLGKYGNATSGTLDNTHLVHNADGTVRISGYEIKMESGEPKIMHHGDATNAARFLANYYRDNSSRINNITYEDTTMLSASWGDGAESNTYAAGVDWDRTGKGYVSAGSTLSEGEIHKGDYK